MVNNRTWRIVFRKFGAVSAKNVCLAEKLIGFKMGSKRLGEQKILLFWLSKTFAAWAAKSSWCSKKTIHLRDLLVIISILSCFRRCSLFSLKKKSFNKFSPTRISFKLDVMWLKTDKSDKGRKVFFRRFF